MSAVLAIQQVADLAMLPAHLRIRPQLTRISASRVQISDEEREVLTASGYLNGEELDTDVLTMLRALAAPDAEINLTLASQGRADTYYVLARSHELVVAAARCGQDVVMDAYVGVDEAQVIDLLTQTITGYCFGADEGLGAAIDRTRFRLNPVYDAMCSEVPSEWVDALQTQGISRALGSVLLRSETDMLARAEVAAYLNHEGGRSEPDSIVRLTTMSDGAIMTSFVSDNNATRWLTVEPYESQALERSIRGAVRSVPESAWFTHCRTD
ncbi:ESX secretion-associated protein EspG [Mycolicibacterium lutetiense]